MITRNVQTILDKAVQDQSFGIALQVDLNKTVASYKLTKEELSTVRTELDKLISKGLVLDNGSGMRK